MSNILVRRDLLEDTLDRYNLDVVGDSLYRSDFRRFIVSSCDNSIEVFVSVAYGKADSGLIASDVGVARLGMFDLTVDITDNELIRLDVDVSVYTSSNTNVHELDTYFIV